MQRTRKLTGVQHMKYYSRASYNCAAHEGGSRVVHKIELVFSTRKLTLMSHASLVQVTQQKYKNTCVLPHTSVNLDVSRTVSKNQMLHIIIPCIIIIYSVMIQYYSVKHKHTSKESGLRG